MESSFDSKSTKETIFLKQYYQNTKNLLNNSHFLNICHSKTLKIINLYFVNIRTNITFLYIKGECSIWTLFNKDRSYILFPGGRAFATNSFLLQGSTEVRTITQSSGNKQTKILTNNPVF